MIADNICSSRTPHPLFENALLMGCQIIALFKETIQFIAFFKETFQMIVFRILSF